MDPLNWLGLAALACMVLFHTLENRSPLFSVAFALSCWMAAAYGYMHGSWPIVAAGVIWGVLALLKFRRRAKMSGAGLSPAEYRVLAWLVRLIGAMAVISGVSMLLVDSPILVSLPVPIGRSIIDALPLLLVGFAYVAWLFAERPAILDLIKQGFIALAFLLWGVDLLMPAGKWAKFVGAIVIAIYVFDLAWVIEGNLRTRLRSDRSEGAGVGRIGGAPQHGDGMTTPTIRIG
jgi:hypothetical protein